ncbi:MULTISPECIES: DsrH/TusB family sulfur metabolism protein [unclassified Pseudoalteromonas]|uniref:DsrH/TusB family sulfur metabolism protein n=1 Tax=unclassified Pseudoalteromonas TaxID=194690 RepID=UPI00390C8F80|nr:DsrH/TusB family sulfur metabolism protein [Ningiella sp. W23]
MSTLHIFSKPLNYYSTHSLDNLIMLTDSVLLVGDACFAKEQYRQFADSLYILKDDADARDISLNMNDKAISYDEFVTLSLSSKQSITW